MIRYLRFYGLALLLVLAVMPITAQQGDATNLTACVETFDADRDYFPHKATFDFADGLTVDYFNHYKVITIVDAFFDAPPFTYVLVQCGTPAPSAEDFPPDALFVEVPVSRVAMLSTTQLPHLVDLDLLDALVAVDSGFFIYNEEVQALVAAGDVAEVGSGASINLELVLDIEPDVVFAYGFNPTTDAHPILIEAGIFTALNGEYREALPLGRAEWLKFTALFFNAEAQANVLFDDIATAYADLQALAADIPDDERLLVLPNAFSAFTDAWSIPGSETYPGYFLQHAGARVVLGDAVQGADDSVLYDFEVIYDAGLDADVWLVNAFGVFTLDDLLAQDERYADFAAFQTGRVYNNVGRVNANGGSDYFEGGITAPHVILADFIAILYPDLLPDHELVYWVPLD